MQAVRYRGFSTGLSTGAVHTADRAGGMQGAWIGQPDPVAYMYILECSDLSLYVGSTRDLEHRLAQHCEGEGSHYTRTRLPVKLLYFEEFDRVSDAYLREKQVQGWSRAKRLALAKEQIEKLPGLSKKDFSGSQ